MNKLKHSQKKTKTHLCNTNTFFAPLRILKLKKIIFEKVIVFKKKKNGVFAYNFKSKYIDSTSVNNLHVYVCVHIYVHYVLLLYILSIILYMLCP